MDAEETQLNDHGKSWHYPELEGMTEAQYEQTRYYANAIAAKNYVTQLCPQGTQIGLDVDNQTEFQQLSEEVGSAPSVKPVQKPGRTGPVFEWVQVLIDRGLGSLDLTFRVSSMNMS